MNLLWPSLLWLVAALPLLPLLYLGLLRRRSKPALRYSSLGVVRQARGPSWRRHLPPLLMLLACLVAVLAVARPTVHLTLPWTRSTIVLAMDVSLSMRVSDVKPNRMAAAQEAAKSFLRELPRDVDVGLVTFAENAQLAQPATLDRASLAGTIDGLQMQTGTAPGDAIVVCLAALFPGEGVERGALEPVKPGSYSSAAIVLLSDGRRTVGMDTIEAARLAADRGVRVYVVGLGTVEGDVASGDDMSLYVRLDEPTLREVARVTGGEYHYAGTADKLRDVYRHLGSRLQVRTQETEITGLLSLLGALLALTAAGLSLAWFG